MNWIALFFSSMSLLNSPTTYIDVIQASASLTKDSNAYAMFEDTAPAANYMLSFTSPSIVSVQSNLTKRKVYKSVEQVVLRDNLGRVSLVTTKFLAKPQWIILLVDLDLRPEFGQMGNTNHPTNTTMEHFAISTDAVALADFASNKSLDTGLAYRIYRAQEYDARDTLNFTFTPK